MTAGEVPVPSQRVFLDVAHDLVDTLGLHRCVHPARARSLHVVPDGTARVECDDAATIHAERVVVATNTAVPVTVHGLVPCAVPAPPRVSATDHVVVIGGGLTAAQVARRVVAAGARLTLVTRRPIVERAFDVDPGWMGPKHLAGYTQLETPAARLEAVRAARDGGSMPAGDHAWLRQLASAGRIDLCEGDPATAVERDGEERIVHLAGGRDVRCDVVVAALGSRFDVEHDPLLGPFVASGQLRSLDGYPQLDPALRVPGTSIHACGRAATLELGPAAGNLSGARRAARRISAHVAGVDPVAADPGVSNRPVVPSRCGPAVVASRSWAG